MSHWLDQRAHNYQGLLRRVRMFVCGYVYDEDIFINQGGGGSVGSGEIFVATDGTAVSGRVRLTCTTGGGSGAAQFSVAYTTAGSPPAVPSPTPTFSDTLTAGVEFQENGIHIFITTSVDWVVGNFIDIDLVPTTNTTPWTERRWVDNQNNSPNFSGDIEWMVQGPGDGSPSPQITVGVQTETVPASSRRNWRCNGFDAFTDTSPQTSYDSQPNQSSSVYVLLNNSPVDFWLTVNSRRFILLARISSGIWEACYLGFFLPIAGTNTYAYPMCVGAMSGDEEHTATTISPEHSAFWDPGSQFSATPTAPPGSLFIRTPAGGYQNFFNKSSGNPDPGNINNSNYDNVVWPWAAGFADGSFRTQYPSVAVPGLLQNIGRTWQFDAGESPFRLARARLPVQSVLISNDFAGGAAQQLGFLDGVYWIPGVGLSASDTFVIESPEVTYLCAQSAYRADSIDFAAIRMDP